MMKTNRLFVDIHVIQTFPPSNMNRDDTGSPKTAQYGGVLRARVSSQAWKKAMREYFREYGGTHNVGVRTLEVVKYVAEKMLKIDASLELENAMRLADNTLNKAGIKTKEMRAKALFFLGNSQATELAQAAINNVDDKEVLQAIIKSNPAIDIALFGRMLADDPSLNEDASAQVAHAISTHAVASEFDFYTAVDDLSSKNSAGAGMLGTIEFNSSTLYRYANVAVHELTRQLGSSEIVVNALSLFVKAFANSLPTGKINTFANQTLPQAIIVTVRDDRPISMVSAFEKPVKSSNGYVEKSIEQLSKEFKNVERFIDKPLFTFYVTVNDTMALNEIGERKQSLNILLQNFQVEISKWINS